MNTGWMNGSFVGRSGVSSTWQMPQASVVVIVVVVVVGSDMAA